MRVGKFRFGDRIPKNMTLFGGMIVIDAVTLAAASLFFHFIEGWDILDSLYFSVGVMGTVGLGDFVPKTPEGKVATMFLIIVGLATFGTVARILMVRQLRTREDHKSRRAKQSRRSQNSK